MLLLFKQEQLLIILSLIEIYLSKLASRLTLSWAESHDVIPYNLHTLYEAKFLLLPDSHKKVIVN